MAVKSAAPTCSLKQVHSDVVRKVGKKLPGEETLLRLAEFFKTYGDRTRLKILAALAESEMCVCDIASVTCMSESAISHQLRILRGMRLVRYRRDGRIIYYSLADDHIYQIIRQGMAHIEE